MFSILRTTPPRERMCVMLDRRRSVVCFCFRLELIGMDCHEYWELVTISYITKGESLMRSLDSNEPLEHGQRA